MATFQIVVRNKGEDGTWKETFDKEEVTDVASATEWTNRTLRNFNDTLREGERERELVRVEWVDRGEGGLQHKWGKVSLVTEVGGYDRYACTRCGITGKRYGLADTVKRDPVFRAKKWDACREDDIEARQALARSIRAGVPQL